MSDVEDEILGPQRYGADKNKVKEISKKKIQLTKLKSAASDSSDESSSSSSSSDSESSEIEEVEDQSDREDAQAQTKKRMLEAIKKGAQQVPTVNVASIHQTKFRDDITKLKSMLTTTEVDSIEDEESEIEEIVQVNEKPKRPRMSISDDDDDDAQSDSDNHQASDTGEEEGEDENNDDEEEEDIGFKLKFSGDRPIQITVNPKRPLQEAFDQFRQRRGGIPNGARVIFKFDGTVLRGNETPESLDMDGGEQIDVTIK